MLVNGPSANYKIRRSLEEVMYPIPGHVSISYLLARSMRLNVGICLVSGLSPDLFDKAMKYILHVYPYGRVIMHSLLGVFVASLVIFLLKGKGWGVSWFVGHLGHLVADFAGDLFTPGAPFVPWLFPFQEYEWPEGKMVFSPVLLLVELVITAFAAAVFYANRERVLEFRHPSV